MAPPSRPPLSARRRLLLIFVLVLAVSATGFSMVLALKAMERDDCLDAGGRWATDACEGARPGG